MADIRNKNELKHRIDVFLHEFTSDEYKINEEYCKETMRMMADFIGLVNQRIDQKDKQINNLKKELKQYRDAEKQGLLLPCELEDSIWVNGILGCGEAEEYKVIRVDYHSTLGTKRNEFYIEALLASNPTGGSIGFYDKEFGKTVFLTKEEAEQALAEMKGV